MTMWCREQRVEMPATVEDSLTTYLDFLRQG
jgi:hypothetical protein